jgi:hypothetical protein
MHVKGRAPDYRIIALNTATRNSAGANIQEE